MPILLIFLLMQSSLKFYYLVMLRVFISIVLLVHSSPLTAQRESKTINNGWSFFKAGDEARPTLVNIPHTWNTDAYHEKDYWKGDAWYTKNLELSPAWMDRQIFLTFEAVSKTARVYVNDRLAGFHSGGYTAFNVDITEFCLFDKINVIKVWVDNSTEDVPPISADFTFFGGIYRDVWLTSVPKQHFDVCEFGSKGIFVCTPEVSEEKASMLVNTSLKNCGESKADLLLELRLFDPEGENVSRVERKLELLPGHTQKIELALGDIHNPVLWSPENPSLYSVELRLLEVSTNKLLDQLTAVTGFRWFSVDSSKGFFLNGKPYKLRGVCRHQDQKPFGVALSDEMHRRDMRLIKDLGANFIRISHYPQDAAIIEMCDRLGLLVWEEIPVIDFLPESDEYGRVAELNLREMIRQHYNHPSVVFWGYMNEILLHTQRMYKGQELDKGIARALELAQHLEKVLKEEDPNRLSVVAFHGSNNYNVVGLGDISDVTGWNLYQGWYGGAFSAFDAFLDNQHLRYPDKPIIVSEYGAGSDRRIHSEHPERFDFSVEYHQQYVEHYLPVIEDRDFVLGASYWNFIDFSSAKRDESMPRINNKGLVYADRTPKDVYYYFKAMWRDDIPVLHLAVRDWDKRTGVANEDGVALQEVKVYSNLSEVELFMNGKSMGKQPVVNRTALFMVPFKEGTHSLRVSGYDGKKYIEDAHKLEFDVVPMKLNQAGWERLELAVNVGSNTYFASTESHLTWLPDQAYVSGGWGYLSNEATQKESTVTQIHLTVDNPLYQTLLKDLSGYRFDVPPGAYEVELLFADIFGEEGSLAYLLREDDAKSEAQCRFKVWMNETLVEEDFSPVQEVGAFMAVKQRYLVEIGEEGLTVGFETINGSSFLNGIKIRKL